MNVAAGDGCRSSRLVEDGLALRFTLGRRHRGGLGLIVNLSMKKKKTKP